jgi:hypothetical protein
LRQALSCARIGHLPIGRPLNSSDGIVTNYCENRVKIEGSAAELEAFARDCLSLRGGLHVLDFEKIMPMPSIVRGLYRSTPSKLGGKFPHQLSAGWVGMEALLRKPPSLPGGDAARTESVLDRDFVKKRGIGNYDDLSSWLLQNDPAALELARKCLAAFEACGSYFEDDWIGGEWGCDPDRVGYHEAALTATSYEVAFQSPWAAPEGIFRHIARRHPGLTSRFSAIEEGNGYAFLLTTANSTVHEEHPEITDVLIDEVAGPGEVESQLDRERAFYEQPPVERQQPTRHFRYWLRNRKLKRMLAGYPAYTPPHLGIEWTMSEQHARENFEYFLAERAKRLDIVKRFLEPFGISLDFTDRARRAVDRWLASYGALLFVSETGASFWTHRPQWAGPRSGLNVIFDLAIYIGEFAIVESPWLSWDIDVQHESGRTRSDHRFQRPALKSATSMYSFPRDIIDETYNICHSLCEASYMSRKPRYRYGSRPLSRQFATKTLRHVYLCARDDFKTANDEWIQDSRVR